MLGLEEKNTGKILPWHFQRRKSNNKRRQKKQKCYIYSPDQGLWIQTFPRQTFLVDVFYSQASRVSCWDLSKNKVNYYLMNHISQYHMSVCSLNINLLIAYHLFVQHTIFLGIKHGNQIKRFLQANPTPHTIVCHTKGLVKLSFFSRKDEY